jgi:predicted O-linked N-acetylglucosamine transferase (SPINDLY family)
MNNKQLDAALAHHRAGRLDQADTIYRQMPNNADALHLRGVLAHQQGRYADALELIARAIELDPANAAYVFSIEHAYRALGRLGDAETRYRTFLETEPDNTIAHTNLGNLLKAQRRFDDAIASYRTALMLDPCYAIAHSNLGSALAAQGHVEEAQACYEKALKLNPDFVEGHYNLAGLLKSQGKLEEAVTSYRRALALRPNFVEAQMNLGSTLAEQDKLDEAIASFRQAIAQKPDFAEAHNNLGNALKKQDKLDEAIDSYQQALAHKPVFAEAYNNLGNAYAEQDRLDEAILCYRQALALQPDLLEAHNILGGLYRRQGRFDDAMNSYLQALSLKPDAAQIHNNMGLLFADQKKDQEAFQCYQTALQLNPEMEEALNNLGTLFYNLGQAQDAITCFENALAAHPDSVDAWTNLGNAYHKQGQPDLAIDCYRKVIAFKPEFLNAHHSLLMSMQYAASVTPEDMAAAHVAFGEQFETPLRALWKPHANEPTPGKRLKIGYLSPDFRQHAVAFFIEPVLAQHDRSQVEVFCYYNHDAIDAVTVRLQGLADHWVRCKFMSDEQLAERIRADGIDILVDLAGHTGGNRLLAFARKPAPVQVTYLGYPATTGLTAIDYRVTDVHAEPAGMTETLNTETLWRLPDIFCCYRARDNSPDVIDHPPSRDNGAVTFGCFNNFAKVTDPVLKLWQQILARVPHSRLILEIAGLDDGTLQGDTETRLANLGLPLERVILVPRHPVNQYTLYNHIDIALDPFPANGGTTSLDTLWMGVPLVTLAGRHFTSRMGVTILTNAGLGQLIAQSEEEYVEIATALATDLPRLSAVRDGLRQRVQASPLMDAPRFTRQLEQAYRGMWERWCLAQTA